MGLLKDELDMIERCLITDTFLYHERVGKTAKILGISRGTLTERLQRYGLRDSEGPTAHYMELKELFDNERDRRAKESRAIWGSDDKEGVSFLN